MLTSPTSPVQPIVHYESVLEDVLDKSLTERLNRVAARREFRYRIRMGNKRYRESFPMFKDGRMVVQNPNYD